MHGVGHQKDLEKQENVREYVDEVKETQKLVEIESSDILGAVDVIVLENKDKNRESSGHVSTQMYLYTCQIKVVDEDLDKINVNEEN